jgi:hypothetical protein
MAKRKKLKREKPEQRAVDLRQAIVKVISAEDQDEYFDERNGKTYPESVNTELEVIYDGKDGAEDGYRFYQRFSYRLDEETDSYVVASDTKLGNLVEVKYGEDFWDSDEEFEAEDLPGTVFMCELEPSEVHKDRTLVVWSSIQPVPMMMRQQLQQHLSKKNSKRPKKSGPQKQSVRAVSDVETDDEMEEEFDQIPL